MKTTSRYHVTRFTLFMGGVLQSLLNVLLLPLGLQVVHVGYLAILQEIAQEAEAGAEEESEG